MAAITRECMSETPCATLLEALRPRKSFGVTAPLVSRRMTPAVSRESHGAALLHSCVTAPGVSPMRDAKSLRFTLLRRSQSPSCMGLCGGGRFFSQTKNNEATPVIPDAETGTLSFPTPKADGNPWP
jgi:hypothetical protein